MKRRERLNFWELTKAFPPILVRLLAKSGSKPMTTAEISQRSKLNPVLVESISMSLTWDGIDIPTAYAFMSACRLDVCNRTHVHRVRDYLRTARFVYLRNSRQWTTYFAPMMKHYLDHLNEKK